MTANDSAARQKSRPPGRLQVVEKNSSPPAGGHSDGGVTDKLHLPGIFQMRQRKQRRARRQASSIRSLANSPSLTVSKRASRSET